jgi:hypothetical protein
MLKKGFASHILRYDMNKVAFASYLIEGETDDVDDIEAKMKKAAWKYWGLRCGSKFGKRAYLLTFTIAYIRVSRNNRSLSLLNGH